MTVPFRELTEEEKTIKETSGKFTHINDNFNFVELTVSSVSRRKEKGIKIYAKRYFHPDSLTPSSDKEKAEREKQEKLEKKLEEEHAKKAPQTESQILADNPALGKNPTESNQEPAPAKEEAAPQNQAFAGEMAGIEDIFDFGDL